MAERVAQEQSARTQLMLLCGAFFFLFLGVAALQQFLVPILTTRVHIPSTAASGIFALVYFSGPLWLGLYPYYFRVLREKWSLVLAGFTYTLFGVLIYFAQEYWLAIVAALLWGWGAETLWATGPAQVVNVAAAPRRGSISGLFQSATYLGQLLGLIFLGALMGRLRENSSLEAARHVHDWMLLAAVSFSLLGNVLSLFLRVRPRPLPPPRLSDAITALRRTAGRYLVLLSGANYLGWGLVLTTFTILIAERQGLDRLAWIVLPYYVGRLLVAWLAGHISDYIGRERVMLVGFLLGAASLVGVAWQPVAWIVSLSAFILGMQSAMISVAMTAAVGDYIRPEERHYVFAGTNAWGYLAGGATMIASPLLKELLGGSFTPSLLLFSVFYGGCAVLAAQMRAQLGREKASYNAEVTEAQGRV